MSNQITSKEVTHIDILRLTLLRPNMASFSKAAILLWIVFLFSGCNPSEFKKPVDDFQKSTEQASTAINSLYANLNTFERDLYFDGIAFNPKQQVAPVLTGKPSLLLSDQFSPEAVAARTRLIEQLANYASSLSQLAGNDAPDKFKTNITSLETSLTGLQGTFNNLKVAGDVSADKYLKPLSDIVSIIGNQALKRKQTQALKSAIIAGERPINDLLDFLAKDLDSYITPLQNTGLQQMLAQRVLDYDQTDRAKLTLEQRQQRLSDIRKAADAYKIAKDHKASTVVLGMKKTHTALVSAVKSNAKPELGALLSSMESYESDVRELVESVNELRNLLTKS